MREEASLVGIAALTENSPCLQSGECGSSEAHGRCEQGRESRQTLTTGGWPACNLCCLL